MVNQLSWISAPPSDRHCTIVLLVKAERRPGLPRTVFDSDARNTPVTLWINLNVSGQLVLLHIPSSFLLSIMPSPLSDPSDTGNASELELSILTNDSPHIDVSPPVSTGEDVERGTPAPLKNPRGFPGLVELVAQDRDQETYVFRKFSKLTAWNLIYKQTELASYEREVETIEATLARDGQSGSMARSWKKFHEEAQKTGTSAHQMKELSDKISRKLSEYRESLSCIV
jgi:hypothetical protein